MRRLREEGRLHKSRSRRGNYYVIPIEVYEMCFENFNEATVYYELTKEEIKARRKSKDVLK